LKNVRIRGKIRREEWPKIAERFQNGETLTEIARSYHCTAPAIRYIVGRVAIRPARGRMERDGPEGVAMLAPPGESRRSAPRTAGIEERSPGNRGRGSLTSDHNTSEIWGRINNDIATFLAAMDTLSANDSDDNYEILLLATDRLLWASARTRLEVERILSNRKKGTAIRRVSG
jgi:hypothetical protein